MKKQNFKNKISNMKGSKGITLVALIITIIILLILAVVAIGAVNNTGIIQYAQNSVDEYKDGRDEENTTLGNYIDILNHYKPTGEKKSEETEIYGDKNYFAVEFITETTGKVYEGGSSTDVTFSNNTIVCDGDVLCGYSVYTLENNKVIIFDSDGHEALTTNGAFGMDNSLLDGKTYNSTGTSGGTMSFNEGKCVYR